MAGLHVTNRRARRACSYMVNLKKQAQLFVYHQTSRRGMPKASSLRCVDCPKQASDYDHYLGYAKKHWLDVQPVCRSCHFKREYKRNPNRLEHLRKARRKRCPHGEFPASGCVKCRRDAYRRWRKKNVDYDRKRCSDNYYKRKRRST